MRSAVLSVVRFERCIQPDAHSCLEVEATAGFEPANRGFADLQRPPSEPLSRSAEATAGPSFAIHSAVVLPYGWAA